MIEMNQKLYFSLLKRYSLLMAGLAVMAFGVAFSIKASLGTSPISSVPYVVSLFAPLTVGTATIVCQAYWQQWIVCLIGILLVAVGVSFEVKAGVVVLAGEGVVLAICQVLPKIKFGYMKVGFDVTLVITACVLSILFTGRLQGVREGTVAAALLVGLIAKRLGKIWERWRLE